jgi:predicted transcriptional regulator
LARVNKEMQMADTKKVRDAIVVAIMEAEDTGRITIKIPVKDANALADVITDALEEQGHLKG